MTHDDILKAAGLSPAELTGGTLAVTRPSGSGTRYQGRNESFAEHQGEATVVWGYGTPEMKCRKQ